MPNSSTATPSACHPMLHVVAPDKYAEGLAYCRMLAGVGVIKVCFRSDDPRALALARSWS
jgi:hypothetical protein